MNKIDVLKGARDLLAKGRWCKGRQTDGNGNYCIMGAIAFSSGTNIWSEDAALSEIWSEDAALSALQQHLPEDEDSLVMYNDDFDTTLQDMLNLIDKTLADKGAL